MKKFVLGVAVLLACLPATMKAEPKPVPVNGTHRIALLNPSINTPSFFLSHYAYCGGNGNIRLGGDEYKRYYLGWDYVLNGELNNADANTLLGSAILPTGLAAYDYVVLPESGLTDGSLSQFDILILSNAVALDDTEQKAIQQWTLKGGRLIATYGSGYKDIIVDSRESDSLKTQKGGTFGLHELWHDPTTKAFGTQAITPAPGTDVLLTTIDGPTAGFGLGVMSYGAEANLIGQRPLNYNDAYAFLSFTPADAWTRPQPAILVDKASRGQVVYMAFAPEFIVSLAFDLAGHCSDDGNYPGGNVLAGVQTGDLLNGFVGPSATRVGPLMQLMRQTVDYMLSTF